MRNMYYQLNDPIHTTPSNLTPQPSSSNFSASSSMFGPN